MLPNANDKTERYAKLSFLGEGQVSPPPRNINPTIHNNVRIPLSHRSLPQFTRRATR